MSPENSFTVTFTAESEIPDLDLVAVDAVTIEEIIFLYLQYYIMEPALFF